MTATYQQIAAAFSPKVVAVIGARKADDYAWLRNMRGFRGKVYSVQIDPNDIPGIEEMGVPNYKSLADIPDQVDYAVIAVPRRVVPFVLKDVIAAGIAFQVPFFLRFYFDHRNSSSSNCNRYIA